MTMIAEQKISKFVLMSLLTTYPDETFSQNVGYMLDINPDLLDTTLKSLVEESIVSSEKLDDLRSDYLALFEVGRGVAPLYETEYGRSRAMFKANELSDLASFYTAFGLEFGSDDVKHDMIDHIAIELEFYSLLLMKSLYLTNTGDETGNQIVLEARKKFMTDHLGKFTRAILDRPGVLDHNLYGKVLQLVHEEIEQECKELNVTPVHVGWYETERDEKEVACGATVGCLK